MPVKLALTLLCLALPLGHSRNCIQFDGDPKKWKDSEQMGGGGSIHSFNVFHIPYNTIVAKEKTDMSDCNMRYLLNARSILLAYVQNT